MNGVLLLHKPVGWTSHDCVMKVRKLFQTKKAGHTGTLDPEVEGVLPICIGKATKIVEYLTEKSKSYDAEVTLGISTTTEDQTGDIITKKPVATTISEAMIDDVLEKLTGNISQIPPMYSAVKVNGKKLYEYARAGIEIERPERTVTIHELKRTSDINQNDSKVSFRFRVHCSKGTYVRTLAVTIGEMLGYPAHMSHLVRTASGDFTLDECVTFEEIIEKIETGVKDDLLLPIERALNHLPKWVISDTLAKKVENGAVLEIPEQFRNLGESDRVVIYSKEGLCIAIYQLHPSKPGLLKPAKVLAGNS
ncbi:tRNA pseudouridine(55) synthase TruB [Bacillus gobiensis]|uniref:tRNA pseudouridine(55) synthase TruB n=1 Tax=Bacillus gobiensis TaxID=1441095 RepID=UPI003D2613F8